MDLGLKNRRALVMGASRGLGRAIAEVLAADGAKVGICAREGARLHETAKAIGAQAFAANLSEDGAGAAVVRDAPTTRPAGSRALMRPGARVSKASS